MTRALSIVMTGMNRAMLLERSLFATCAWQQFQPEQAELVYVDDRSDDAPALLSLLKEYSHHFSRVMLVTMDKSLSRIPVAWNCPALGLNIGVKAAANEIVLKTDPECLPLTETIVESLRLFDPGKVLFFSTRMLTEEETVEFAVEQMELLHPQDIHEAKLKHLARYGLWSVYANGARYAYWFGAVFSRERFLRIGGVDEQFLLGFAWDDDDWANRMQMSGAEWCWPESLRIVHQFHGTDNRKFHLSPEHRRNIALVRKNMESRKITANQGEDWGSESAVVDRLEIVRGRARTFCEDVKTEVSA